MNDLYDLNKGFLVDPSTECPALSGCDKHLSDIERTFAGTEPAAESYKLKCAEKEHTFFAQFVAIDDDGVLHVRVVGQEIDGRQVLLD